MERQMRPASYDMSGQRRALLLIVRDKEKMKCNRCSFEVDRQTMEKFFEGFGFQYRSVLDETAQEMKEEVINFRNSINSSSGNISCVFVATSSHGHRDVIIGADKKTLAVKDIIEPFGDELCPKTKGKPKVFIIDACRGSNHDTGVHFDSAADEKRSKEAMATKEYRSTRVPPCINDMLVAYAAMTDYVGMMNSTFGSHMIYNISQVFSSPGAAEEHVYNLFVKANAKMVATPVDVTVDEGKPTQRTERRKIIMTMESTLRKTLYLRSSNESGVKTIEQKGRK
ncbi:caspase-14-like isoform X2 [Oncorhynchus keta]|uniref:caspase-14-like isoform X2 n=1 Tax=Oncorhynchus keta TaxID=8018 RepID=UPI00227B72E3|nr:caspase-14-like isoform X2 [Oncorhynchus keta]